MASWSTCFIAHLVDDWMMTRNNPSSGGIDSLNFLVCTCISIKFLNKCWRRENKKNEHPFGFILMQTRFSVFTAYILKHGIILIDICLSENESIWIPFEHGHFVWTGSWMMYCPVRWLNFSWTKVRRTHRTTWNSMRIMDCSLEKAL